MKKKIAYMKPQMLATSLVSKQKIADDCWSPSHHATFYWFYNDQGFGGVQFQMNSTGTSCSANFEIVGYVDNSGTVHGTDYASTYLSYHPEYTSVDDIKSSVYDEVLALVRPNEHAQGNHGESFGTSPSISPEPPSWQWSL